MLRLEGLAKRFDHVPVLEDVSLEVAPGEIVAVLGPSGEGKTTLLRVVAGLLRPDAGFVRWKGHDMQPRPYDNVEQAVDRVVRSILSWEACAQAAAALDYDLLLKHLAARETAKAEDLMREAVVEAQRGFDRMYKG